MPNELVAWDGTAKSFWDAVSKYESRTFIESDAAVLSEVLALALNSKDAVKKLLVYCHQLEMQIKELTDAHLQSRR